MSRKAQVIKCKCGKAFAACIEPECYTDKEWLRDLRKYVMKGSTVEMMDTADFKMESCVCDQQKETLTLF